MKRLLLLVGVFNLNCTMELTQEAIAGGKAVESKDKSRVKVSNSSGSSETDSSEKMRVLEKKIFLRTLALDEKAIKELKEQLAQYEQKASARSLAETPLSADDKKKNRLSVVYLPIPPLDLSKQKNDPTQDIEKGQEPTLTDKDYKAMVEHYAKEKGLDLSQIEGRLVSLFKAIDKTPPNSPNYDANKAQALTTYRKAVQVHTSAHTDLATARQTSPIQMRGAKVSTDTNSQAVEARGPTITEIIEDQLGANATEVLESVARATVEAFNQKLTDAGNTQKKTVSGGALVTLIAAGLTAAVTWWGTKSHC